MNKRIQRKRTKGWRMPEGAVYVGRPSIWGNPYEVGFHTYGMQAKIWTGQDIVQLYAQIVSVIASAYGMTQDEFLAPLRGHDLACWCPLDQPCHADILLRLAVSK